MKTNKQETREQAIYKVTWIGFFVNVLLSVGKLIAGFVGRSGAMIADGVHSVFDFASDLVVLLLSLSYIPAGKIVYSLLTVILSGQLIGLIAPKNAE